VFIQPQLTQQLPNIAGQRVDSNGSTPSAAMACVTRNYITPTVPWPLHANCTAMRGAASKRPYKVSCYSLQLLVLRDCDQLPSCPRYDLLILKRKRSMYFTQYQRAPTPKLSLLQTQY
jgi:hypothetical protein